MKKQFTILLLLCICPFILKAQNSSSRGSFTYKIVVNSGTGDNYNSTNGSTLAGSPYCAGSIVLLGAENHSYQNSTWNVTAVSFNYRIYTSGSPSGSFIAMDLGPVIDTQTNGDKFWQISSSHNAPMMTTNLINGLSAGNYVIEYYYKFTANYGDFYDSNNSANYTNTFTVNATPSAPSITADKNIVCTGSSATLTASTCSGTITWSNAATASPTTVTTAGSYTANCTIGGCVSAASSAKVITTSCPATNFDSQSMSSGITPTTVDVAANDINVDPLTVKIVNGGSLVTSLVVSQGTWSVRSTDGQIIFTPNSSTSGVPSQITYSISNATGITATSTLTLSAAANYVTLIDFSSTNNKEKVVIKWSTGMEINADKFVLYKSNDAVNFEVLTTIKSVGTSSVTQNYEFVDNYPYAINYYRLKSIDFDGSAQWSNIISNHADVSTVGLIVTNPSKNNSFKIFNTENVSNIELYNQIGVKVDLNVIKQSNYSNITLPQNQNSGVYLLKITNNNNEIEVHRILIE